MRIKVILLFLIAAGAAATTVTFAKSWLLAQQNAMDARLANMQVVEIEKPVMVLVVKESAPAGSFLKPNMLRWMPFPEEGVAESYFVQETEDQEAGDGLEGVVVRSGLTAGEPVTRGRIVVPGDRGFLAAVITPGSRAVSVPLNATTGIAGFVFPGDMVDIILTHTIKTGDISRRASETIIRGVRVLAMDQRFSDQDGEAAVAKTATLEVSSKQAEIVAVGLELGKLSLALRSLALTEAEEASVEDGEVMIAEKLSYTWDNQASQLIYIPGAASDEDQVRVVRRGEETLVSVSRSGK